MLRMLRMLRLLASRLMTPCSMGHGVHGVRQVQQESGAVRGLRITE